MSRKTSDTPSPLDKWRAKRVAALDIFKKAVTTRTGRIGGKRRKLNDDARARLTHAWRSHEKVDLPFIDEFITIPRRDGYVSINYQPSDYVRQVCSVKDIKFFSRWTHERLYSHSDMRSGDEPGEKTRDTDLEERMSYIVTRLVEEKRDALRAFCKTELAALQSARDACVERMLQWCSDSGDADAARAVCGASTLFAEAAAAASSDD